MKKLLILGLSIVLALNTSISAFADENGLDKVNNTNLEFIIDIENNLDKSSILEFEKSLNQLEREEVEYFVEENGQFKEVSRDEALSTRLPSVAAVASAKINEISGEYANVTVNVVATAPIRNYKGTVTIYDAGFLQQYERSTKNITLPSPGGTEFLSEEYVMYVGNANRARVKLTNGFFEDTYGRTGSLTPVWSGYFER